MSDCKSDHTGSNPVFASYFYIMARITVIMPDEVNEQVIQLAKKEKRSKSAMAALLIEDGLKLVKQDAK